MHLDVLGCCVVLQIMAAAEPEVDKEEKPVEVENKEEVEYNVAEVNADLCSI